MASQFTPAYYTDQPLFAHATLPNSGLATFLRPTVSEDQPLLSIDALPITAAQRLSPNYYIQQPMVYTQSLAPIVTQPHPSISAMVQGQDRRRVQALQNMYFNAYA
jgi:hypothetical protein